MLSRERRSEKASVFEIGGAEKWRGREQWFFFGGDGSVVGTRRNHCNKIVTGLVANHRATEMTEGLIGWGVTVYF